MPPIFQGIFVSFKEARWNFFPPWSVGRDVKWSKNWLTKKKKSFYTIHWLTQYQHHLRVFWDKVYCLWIPISATPSLKTNISPENWWLDDDWFPFKTVPFQGIWYVIFMWGKVFPGGLVVKRLHLGTPRSGVWRKENGCVECLEKKIAWKRRMVFTRCLLGCLWKLATS